MSLPCICFKAEACKEGYTLDFMSNNTQLTSGLNSLYMHLFLFLFCFFFLTEINLKFESLHINAALICGFKPLNIFRPLVKGPTGAALNALK